MKKNSSIKSRAPNFRYEREFLVTHGVVAGVDEAGVGPLAGPVVAAAVVLNEGSIGRTRSKRSWWYEVRDSKMLTHQKREELVKKIFANSASVGLGSASATEIDSMNILQARLLAMKRAVMSLKISPRMVLVDGNAKIPKLSVPQLTVIRGDEKILSVSCASIVAKVTRDNILKNLHVRFPQYGFDQHKGYPTRLHQQRIKQFGPCEEHRRSFYPIRELLK